MADNLKRQFDQVEDFESPSQQQMPTSGYQEYESLNNNSIKLQDLIFFGRISAFCVSTCLVAFLFLVAQVATFWSFFWAIVISALCQVGIQYLIHRQREKNNAE